MMRSTLIAALVSAALPMMALAQTAEELKNDEKTPGDVLTYGMGYSQHRFSPLTHINRDNVKRLVPAWSYSMADNRGQEAQALVKDGIIYLTDHEKTVALDALSGKQIWKSVIEYPPDTTRDRRQDQRRYQYGAERPGDQKQAGGNWLHGWGFFARGARKAAQVGNRPME